MPVSVRLSRMTPPALACGLAALLTLILATPAAAQKGKPAPAPNAVASVTFADRADDDLVSDGGGGYEGATLYGSGTLWLDVAASGRSFRVELDAAKVGQTSSANHIAPGWYVTGAPFRVDNIDHAPLSGAWVRSVGRIGLNPGVPNHALGFRYATANGVPVYGTEVCVKRLPGVTPATWHVASSDACSLEGGNAGLFEEGLKGKGIQFEAVYQVKFLATVVCTSGSTCPQ